MSDVPETECPRGEPPRSGTAAGGGLWLTTAAVAALGAIFTVVALVAFGSSTALGVGLGAAVAVATLAVFVWVVRGILGRSPYARIWVLVAIVKIFALFGGIWLLFRAGICTPLSLILGYGSLPLGIALGGLLAPKLPPGADDPSSPDDPGAQRPD